MPRDHLIMDADVFTDRKWQGPRICLVVLSIADKL